jgi:peptidoglycan/LPS O-acetylase OafA/YrhL
VNLLQAHSASPPEGGLDDQVPRGKFRPDIEGLRAVAVVAVVLYHAEVPGIGGGFVGVDVFFVISGFLITGLLWRETEATNSVRLRRFYGARARRLLPAAAVVGVAILICAAVLLPLGQAGVVFTDGIASALYVSNYWTILQDFSYFNVAGHLPPSPFLHYWSLGVEEQFYLVWPLVVRFVSRKWLERICLLLFVLAPVTHFFMDSQGNSVGAYVFTGSRLNTLATGALLAVIFRDQVRWQKWMRHASTVGWGAGAICLFGLIFPAYTYITLAPFAPLLWGSLLMHVVQPLSRINQAFSGRVLVTFGKYSYGLYLLHYLFDPWLKEVLYPKWIVGIAGNGAASVALFMLVATILTFSAALLSWNLLEKPFLLLKRHFRY